MAIAQTSSAATAPAPFHRQTLLCRWFFAAGAIYHLACIIPHWSRPIADFNPWRQSQTAIATAHFLSDGVTLAYSLPVLGPPWSIPFEFPTYQLIVAALTRVTSLPMESCGRLVSLLAFYAALPAIWLLLGGVLRLTYQRWLTLGLLLIAPTYISLSRTFSIESTALALALWYLVWFHRWLVRPSLLAGVLLVGLGALAALTKITTFFTYAVATLPVLLVCRREWLVAPRSHLPRALLTGVLAFAIPLGLGMAWTHYADGIKSASPLTAHLTSSGLNAWNFGSLAQRLSLETVRRFELFANNLFCSRYLLLFAGLCLALHPARWRATLALLALFAVPTLVFTNLYFAHDYYWYANGVFVLGALGLAFGALVESPSIPWRAALIGFVLVFYQYRNTHAAWYGPKQATGTSPALPLAAKLRELTAPADFALVYGFDWDPTLAYHSQRRMIMESARHTSVPVNAEPLASALARAGREHLAAIVFVGEIRDQLTFVQTQRAAVGAAPTPSYHDDFGTIYLVPRPRAP